MKHAPTSAPSSTQWTYPLVLLIAIAVVFGNLASAEFSSLDDPYNIWQNPRLNPPTLENIAYYWKNAEYGLYIPITYTIWGLLAVIAQVPPDPAGVTLNPWVFHTFSIAMHMISALAVLAILNELIGNRRAGAIGALLFALHPVQVESVAWAAGLKDVLSGMFGLIAIWLYIRSARGGSRGVYALATLSLVLGMLSKPSAMTVPAMALAIDALLIRRPWKEIGRWIGPWAVLSVVCAVIARISQNVTDMPPVPLWARPFIAGDALSFYLYKLLWPMELSVDYGRRPAAVMEHWWFYVAWVLPAALVVVLWLRRRRAPVLAVAGLIFLAGVSPVLGLTTFLFQYFSTTSDHYLYPSMLGVALAAAWVVDRFHNPLIVSVASTLIGLLGIRSMVQTHVWQNSLALFSNSYAITPDGLLSINNLGNTYQLEGRLDLAEQLFRKATQLHPDYPQAHTNLALMLEYRGAFAEALEHRRAALEIYRTRRGDVQWGIPDQLAFIAEDLIELGRYDEAAAPLREAKQWRPDDPRLKAIEEKLRERAAAPSTTTAPVTAPATTSAS